MVYVKTYKTSLKALTKDEYSHNLVTLEGINSTSLVVFFNKNRR